MKAEVDRNRAILEGRKRYFTGRPCRRGHVAERYVRGHMCIECAALKSASDDKKQYDRQRYAARRDEAMERVARWVAENPERARANKRRWEKKNPEKVAANSQNQAGRRRAATDSGVKSADLREWVSAQKKVCYWCGARCAKSFHVDHYEPLATGGAHELSNLVIACPGCNRKKNAKDPLEFAATVGRLL